MTSTIKTSSSIATPRGRRGFLAGLAATPLVAAGLASCSTHAPSQQPTSPGTTGAAGSAAVTASTTATGRRMLGTLEVSSTGLGTQTMAGNLYGPVTSRADMVNIVRTAADQGVTLFDTAEAYGPFECEAILGDAVQPVRDSVVLSSKFGWDIDPVTGQRTGGLNSRPDHIRTAIEGMLRRLKTDRLDMVFQHRVDPAVPVEDVAGTIRDLVGEGKVLHWGLSEPGLETVRRAHAVQPLSAIQNEYSMMERGPEDAVLPLCEELGIGFVCWAPLAYGVTTGTITPYTRFVEGDFRPSVPRNSPDNLRKNMPVIELLQDWGVRKGATPAQISLAWLQAQKPWIVPIPSATRLSHLLENIASEEVTFTPDELTELTTALDAIKIHGARLAAPILSLSGVEAPAA